MNATTGLLAAQVWDQAHVVVEATELAGQLGTESAEITRVVAMADMNRALDAMSIGEVKTFDDIRALAWFANWQMPPKSPSIRSMPAIIGHEAAVSLSRTASPPSGR